ncbi:hypothetical protein GALMADRAFT_213919 [Galerina marginata CBS 339.88]|uniref:Uncharacterized protein n=1 Tax=Galerina marginata (strain CBS 339.88) TaxID=685588 RepID=A0A067SL17_GALM3|nr:hypothetical protein GALMADRAFT_213919 [Galerina marginata CBS 339.88]
MRRARTTAPQHPSIIARCGFRAPFVPALGAACGVGVVVGTDELGFIVLFRTTNFVRANVGKTRNCSESEPFRTRMATDGSSILVDVPVTGLLSMEKEKLLAEYPVKVVL